MKPAKTKVKTLARTLFKKAKPSPAPAAHRNGLALQINAPAAKTVLVAGTFNNWQATATPLKPAAGGLWRGELKLAPGRYEYLFVVDGQWQTDPQAKESAPNPFGGLNSVVSVG